MCILCTFFFAGTHLWFLTGRKRENRGYIKRWWCNTVWYNQFKFEPHSDWSTD